MIEQHTEVVIIDGKYQLRIFYTDDPVAPDDPHETEWVIFRISDSEQVATGWGPTPRQAHQEGQAALARLRGDQIT